MIRLIVALSTFASVVAARSDLIKHLHMDDANLIESSETNFAMAASSLMALNWKTVSINEEDIYTVEPQCHESVTPLGTLTDSQRSEIAKAKKEFASVASNQSSRRRPDRWGLASYSAEAGQPNSLRSHGYNNVAAYGSNELSVTSYGHDNWTVGRPNLPKDLRRVFVTTELVTYVYIDGHVQMKPRICLSKSEQELVAQLEAEALQAF